jgi:hypothetical protein
MAVYIVNSWLMLRDATLSERKRDLAQVYLAEHLPQVRSAHAVIMAADETPLAARETVLDMSL